MLRQFRLLTWLILIFSTSIILIGFYQVMATDSQMTTDSQSVSKKEVRNITSKYPGLNLESETKETETYTISVSSPVAKSEKINEPIRAWIKEQKDEFFAGVSANKQMLGDGYRAHLNIQVDTEHVVDNVYHLIFNSYQFVGGANGQALVNTFTVDTANHKILTLDDIMKTDEKSLADIRALAIEQLKKNEDLYFYVFDDQLEDALEDLDQWKWSINEQTFTLYFDEYEIASGVAGTIQVHIPIHNIVPYLNEDIAKQLEVSKKQDSKEDVKKDQKKETELNPEGKYVALTFDDGPSPEVTPRILATLEEHQIKATFFMLGTQIDYYPTIAKEVVKAGHEAGNHTENHMDLTKLSEDNIRIQIEQTSEKIKEATGTLPELFRPPYGVFNDDVMQIVDENKNDMVLWSVDSLDWESRDAVAVNEVIQKDVTPGSIVLMHDIHSSTADALPELLTALEEEGYEFVTVSQLLTLQKKERDFEPHHKVSY